MDRRRFLGYVGSVAAGPLWVSACAPTQRLVVATHPWVGYEALFLAREFKWLPQGVELRESKSASDFLAALQAGEVDAACLTLDELLRARAAGIPLSVALVFDVSAGADMVLARPGIAKPADLAGKRIGLEKNALGELVLLKLLEAAGLPESAIRLVDLPLDRQLEAWRKGEVDAVITYEPTGALLLREGAQRIFDSTQMPDTILDVLAVRRDRVSNAGQVRELVAAHFRGVDYLRTHAEDAVFRIAQREGLSADEVRRTLAGVAILSLAINRGYLLGADPRLQHAARNLSALMVKRGLLPQADRLEHLIMPGMLPGDEK